MWWLNTHCMTCYWEESWPFHALVPDKVHHCISRRRLLYSKSASVERLLPVDHPYYTTAQQRL